jgi:hypothetical protein
MSGYLAIQTAGLPATISTALKYTTRSVYGDDGGFDGAVVDSAMLTGEHDEDTVRRAITICEEQCRPGGHRVAAEELAILECKTVGPKQGEADRALRGAVYGAELAQYPADIIRLACRRWADGSRWWPALAALKCECDRLAAKRKVEHRALLAALQRATTPRRPQLEAPKVGATPADRSRDLIAHRQGKGDVCGAAIEERWPAQHQRRDVEAWAKPIVAEIEAEEERRREEFAALAEAPSKSAPADARLAAAARQARDRLMGVNRSEAAK